MLDRLRVVGSWLHAHGDPLFAIVFAIAWLSGAVGGAWPNRSVQLSAYAVCGLLATVPFAVRRRRPELVVVIVTVAIAVLAYALPDRGLPIGAVLAALLMSYSLGAHGVGRRAALIGVGAAVVVTISGAPHNDSGVAGLILTPALFLCAPYATGLLVARLRSEHALLRELTLRLEREGHDLARASVLEERARIARELHDVIAHGLTLMVVQAGAAAQYVPPDGPARECLDVIRVTGQESLVEMRRLVGVLRTDDLAPALGPLPGLTSLDALVNATRGTGLDVSIEVHGDPVALPAGLDVAAYRLVQESLSNVRKHAKASAVLVDVDYEPSRLTLAVTDDGALLATSPTAGNGGHGIVGMRERVALFGGRFDCGPLREGGWQMRAELPLGT